MMVVGLAQAHNKSDKSRFNSMLYKLIHQKPVAQSQTNLSEKVHRALCI